MLHLPDTDATSRLGAAIGRHLRRGDAVLLDGPLGAGKTTLARALLREVLGNQQLEVPSPSYTLVQTYDGPAFPLHHFDLWRLTGPEALHELGWDDARDDVVIVEWPGRLGQLMPRVAARIVLVTIPGGSRAAVISGWPDRVPAILADVVAGAHGPAGNGRHA